MLAVAFSKCCTKAKDSSELEALVAHLFHVGKVVNVVGLAPRLYLLSSLVVVMRCSDKKEERGLVV